MYKFILLFKYFTVSWVTKNEKVYTCIYKLLFLTECHLAYEQELFNIGLMFHFLFIQVKFWNMLLKNLNFYIIHLEILLYTFKQAKAVYFLMNIFWNCILVSFYWIYVIYTTLRIL